MIRGLAPAVASHACFDCSRRRGTLPAQNESLAADPAGAPLAAPVSPTTFKRRALLWLLALVVALPPFGQTARQAAGQRWAEDRAEPLEPLRERSEEDRDRIHAATLFLQGRLRQLRGENQQALRLLAEAYFWDPRARTALPDVVTLAAAVGNTELALRYAELAVQRQAIPDPHLERQLAGLLSQEGRLDQAAELYRRILEGRSGIETDPDLLIASFERGRLAYLLGHSSEAGQAMLPVWRALAAPADPAAKPEWIELREQLLEKAEAVFSVLFAVFLEADMPEQAAEVLERLNATSPSPALAALRDARLALARKQYQEADASLERYFSLEDRPADWDAVATLAELYLPNDHGGPGQGLDGGRDALIGRLEALLKQHPDQGTIAMALAQQLLEADQVERAAILYRQLLDQQPSLSAYQGLIQAQLAAVPVAGQLAQTLLEVYQQAGDPQLLGPAWQAILQNGPLLEQLIAELDRRYERAEGPERAELAALALLLASESEPLPEIRRWWKPLLDGDADKPVALLVELSGRLVERQQYAAADQLLEALAPKATAELQPLVYYYWATAQSELERHEQAIRRARQAVDAAADQLKPLLALRLGWVLTRAGQVAEAEALYRRLVDQASAPAAAMDQQEVLREARMLLSNLYLQQGRPDESERLLVAHLMEFPADPTATNDLAYMWADRGIRLERAARMLEQVVAAEPDNAAFRDSLGWAYFRLGQYARAVEQLRVAAEGDPPDPIILEHYGDALWETDEPQAARRAWRHALERLGPDASLERRRELEAKIERQSTE